MTRRFKFQGMKDIRLAIVHNTISPYRHALFECLSKRMDLIVYYCSVKHGFRKWDLWPKKYYYRYIILPRIPIGEASMNPSIIRRLLSNRPDILMLCGYIDPTMWLASIVARILRIPVAYWTEGIREPKTLVGTITRPLRSLFIKRSRAIIVPGKLSKEYVMSLGAEGQKVFIAPNSVDNSLFARHISKYRTNKEQLKRKLGINNQKIILYVGQLIERKGINYLLTAFTRLKRLYQEWALVVVGSGTLRNQLEQICRTSRIGDVFFKESGLKLTSLIEYYAISDVFVLPTLEDVWGFVINEAMACGLPVIATRSSQAAIEMISEGLNGIIVKEADAVQLYEALAKLASDDILRKRMARKSKDLVSRFSPRSMSDGFVKAIDYVSMSSS